MINDIELTPASPSTKKWHPLSPIERRIVGVLVEKAKTTPDGYPMSLNALVTGCNQKSNRDPQMQVSDRQVEDTLEALRKYGAVTEVQGSGRVPKYRHHMKEWLGVDGNELAVMTELLLRGSQSVGDLRGRAARMAAGQLPDIAALRPALDALIEKQLVVELTPAGRGQWVTHALFSPDELERERRQSAHAASADGPTEHPASPLRSHHLESNGPPSAIEALRQELATLRADLDALTSEVASLQDKWNSFV